MNSKVVSQLSRRESGCIVKGDMTLQHSYAPDPPFDQCWHSLLLYWSINGKYYIANTVELGHVR